MIFNAFQRDDDDAVFTVVRNVSGGARAVGDSVVWDITASVDGVRVSVPATATLSLFRGILVEALADSAYGKCQVHGYNSAAAVQDTSSTMVAGDILAPANGVDALIFNAASDGTTGFVYAAEDIADDTSAEVLSGVLIRAL
jgi:hypothetical protein